MGWVRWALWWTKQDLQVCCTLQVRGTKQRNKMSADSLLQLRGEASTGAVAPPCSTAGPAAKSTAPGGWASEPRVSSMGFSPLVQVKTVTLMRVFPLLQTCSTLLHRVGPFHRTDGAHAKILGAWRDPL